MFSNCVELKIPIRFADEYVAPIVAGLTDVFIDIPVPAERFRLITGDTDADPAVENVRPLPSVGLNVKSL
jgi:hypothetical protein